MSSNRKTAFVVVDKSGALFTVHCDGKVDCVNVIFSNRESGTHQEDTECYIQDIAAFIKSSFISGKFKHAASIMVCTTTDFERQFRDCFKPDARLKRRMEFLVVPYGGGEGLDEALKRCVDDYSKIVYTDPCAMYVYCDGRDVTSVANPFK